ncbi:MAG TPA: preprotein translocase subunit YajC [Pirellulaceae bacterium]
MLLAEDAAAEPGRGGWSGLLQGPLPLFVLLPLLFYFMVMGPEKKRRTEHLSMLSGLKKNDLVITAGGLYGTVVNAQDGSEDITLRVDDSSNTRIRVLRSSIARVVRAESKAEA